MHKNLAFLIFMLNFFVFSCFASQALNKAIKNPEYLIDNWIVLPTYKKSNDLKPKHLSLKEAILLALRYNPNIQNTELDRILQVYQLRLANNEFELQYALAGSAQAEKNTYSGVGNAITHSYLATPEFNLKTKLGSQLSLSMDNNVSGMGGYNPLLNARLTQPLLRGFGKTVNEASLLDATDANWLNKLNLYQTVMDQISQVITTYRSLILSGNNLQNQKQQLIDAKNTYEINQKRIAAGQLEEAFNVQQAYQVETLELMVEQAENDFMIASQELLQIIGLDPDLKLSVPHDVDVEKTTLPKLEDAITKALKNNTQYLAYVIALKKSKRDYKVAKNQQLWDLSLTANVQTGTMTDVDANNSGIRGIYNGNNTTQSAGVILKIPLHDLERRNQLITAKIRLEKDRINLIAAKRALITSIKNTITTIQSQEKQYYLAKKQLMLAEKSYDLEKKKQRAGISSALDVNNTQNQLIQAQSRLISSKISYLNQLTALHRLLGTTLKEWKIKLQVG